MAFEAYEVDGIWFWSTNDAPVPVDSAAEYGIPVDPQRQHQAVSEANQKAIEAYKKFRQNYKHSNEELYEMRAAFGEGAKVVDVFTGQVTQL